MSITQGAFLAVTLATACLCLITAFMSLQRGLRYREGGELTVRFFAGAVISAMLAIVVLITSYEHLTVHREISAIDWLRLGVDLALGGLFLAILRGTARRDHIETRLEEASQTDPLTVRRQNLWPEFEVEI